MGKPSQALVKQFIDDSLADQWASFVLPDTSILAETGQFIMANVPPQRGHCAMLSSAWAMMLRENFDIPALVVCGDLYAGQQLIFKSKNNIPDFSAKAPNQVVSFEVDGHCWLDIGGYICDLSIFRTAYAIDQEHALAKFVNQRFGAGRGIFICPYELLGSSGFKYVPKSVLKDSQVEALWQGLGYQIRSGQL